MLFLLSLCDAVVNGLLELYTVLPPLHLLYLCSAIVDGLLVLYTDFPLLFSLCLSLQVLVRVRACGINPVDPIIFSGNFTFKPELPFIPGTDIAGDVEKVGAGVTNVKVSLHSCFP